ncbi:winged helix-turn-helix domain-containing protein, partial [Dokdonella sp.]|uniref:winged helix-turn-helix domain-containing protein n=1 Tax=Dokdonella sp. TaxID=2291710 RepID=UPI002F41BB8C
MPSFRFDDYELVPESRRLIRDGADVVVGVRVFDLIAYLVGHRDRAVGRDELISAVWGRSEAGDALLAQAVLKARRALGDDGHAQHHIRTVTRFGYQWVAATRMLDAPSARSADDDTTGRARARALSSIAVPVRRRGVVIGAALLLALGAALLVHRAGPLPPQAVAGAVDAGGVAKPVPGLVLVVPTRVQGDLADDGWMRLGMMSLLAQALRDLPGHAVVPDETALAAISRSGADDLARLRAETGATIVVASEAARSGDAWSVTATVFGADGASQMVGGRSADAVSAGGVLAREVRQLLADGADREDAEPLPVDVVALRARMRAAILEGQNGRALALYDAASPDATAAPAAILQRSEALIQLGRADEAARALQSLIERSNTAPAMRWLGPAWSALGDCELARGRYAVAEAHFRRSLALLGATGDRRAAGLAWRGLGIAQVVRNDLDDAEQSYLHARVELESSGDRLALARITDGLGYIATRRGRVADALLSYEQAAAMAAAFGANETELGSRLNIAQAHEALLQHALALQRMRELLPRLRGLDYPALHRFGMVAYAAMLAESGAFPEARGVLAGLDAEGDAGSVDDAVVDVRLDEAQVSLAIGDAAGALRRAEAVMDGIGRGGAADARLEAAALLLQLHLQANDAAADVLGADEALWQPANALALQRMRELLPRLRGL